MTRDLGLAACTLGYGISEHCWRMGSACGETKMMIMDEMRERR